MATYHAQLAPSTGCRRRRRGGQEAAGCEKTVEGEALQPLQPALPWGFPATASRAPTPVASLLPHNLQLCLDKRN
jgi:hypothetical protein